MKFEMHYFVMFSFMLGRNVVKLKSLCGVNVNSEMHDNSASISHDGKVVDVL